MLSVKESLVEQFNNEVRKGCLPVGTGQGERRKVSDNYAEWERVGGVTKMDYLQRIEHNKKSIIDKDFLDLSEQNIKQFILDAKTKYFYFKKDGVNVACGKELDNNNGKFDIEMFACKKLAEYGHEVYLLPENYAVDAANKIKVHGDTITDDRTLELKHTPSNIQSNYRKAKHQATDVFIHVQDDISKKDAIDQIKRAIRSMKQNNKSDINFAGNVYLYFERMDMLSLLDFDKNGNYKNISPRKNRASEKTKA